ncbi:MAG: Re/Si-specific NAD(P)(+) transhydrogenase subunit alpha [Bacteroidia bacterium]|nr:Re/Si-specific NAD(P)(+) transhydrogenase subunit alpha [Bacteroidia bacterium]MCX7651894.1 Re/Si-specific NAD(P)(+) transhydrogenase subunit alpha [Bacteroidia bacterium]MDW8416045.1 Re/Si-specific NAD(P)(+) transhydrogenase subunit alpha [Bacteroidia bacterium]
MKVGFLRESSYAERRVVLLPDTIKRLGERGFSFVMQTGAGADVHYADREYEQVGVQIFSDAVSVVKEADILLRLRMPTREELDSYPDSKVLIGILQAWQHEAELQRLAAKKWSVFALERIPRITRAQSMDVLSSMAALGGYKAVLLAAAHFGRVFPMLTTAAGTLTPARVLVIGAGVAGLQAIATARRLGAQVEAYDIRAAAKEQVESLGAKFLPLTLESSGEASGGYARELTSEEQAKQREALSAYVARADIVITTAAVPGRPAPKLITADMRRAMKPGSVIVDLAAETGGNCQETIPGETQVLDGITLIAPLNLPASIPIHASQMLSRNFMEFLSLFRKKDGTLSIHTDDELLKGTCLLWQGESLLQTA